MKRYLGPLLLAIVLAVATHVATVRILPYVFMRGAMNRNASHGAIDKWYEAPRVTAASRTVVHPSPELAYSACVYDLRNGPVHIGVQPMDDYWSLSLYATDAENFRAWNYRTSPQGTDIWLVGSHGADRPPPSGVSVVQSPSNRGLALIRRHVVDDASWSRIEQARQGDRCEPVP